jgi:hypothetical protein
MTYPEVPAGFTFQRQFRPLKVHVGDFRRLVSLVKRFWSRFVSLDCFMKPEFSKNSVLLRNPKKMVLELHNFAH